MGVGDALMASGEVKELRKKNPKLKFIIGDGKRDYWSEVFDYNPYIIRGSEINKYKEVCWINNYEGNRPYRNYGKNLPKDNYNWKKNFKPKKGEIFFSEIETKLASEVILSVKKKIGQKKLIFIEPHVKKRLGYQNRDWGFKKWKKVIAELKDKYEFIQITYGNNKPIEGCINVHGLNFRSSVAILSMCDLFVGTEGGMHHAAAATNREALVIFGGHISPKITGYDYHSNLYIDLDNSPCGIKNVCKHCEECMDLITIEMVIEGIKEILNYKNI